MGGKARCSLLYDGGISIPARQGVHYYTTVASVFRQGRVFITIRWWYQYSGKAGCSLLYDGGISIPARQGVYYYTMVVSVFRQGKVFTTIRWWNRLVCLAFSKPSRICRVPC